MPQQIESEGEKTPIVPGVGQLNEAGFSLPIPAPGDVADVPNDMKLLAEAVRDQLRLRLTEYAAAQAFQSKIAVYSTLAEAQKNVSKLPEGSIVFIVGT